MKKVRTNIGLPAPEGVEVSKLFREYDSNNDGYMNFDEYFEAFISILKSVSNGGSSFSTAS